MAVCQGALEHGVGERARGPVRRDDMVRFLLHVMAHDLKAAAVAVHGVSGQLLERYGDRLPEDGRRLLRRLQANAEYQERLLHDLATLAGVDGSKPASTEVSVLDVIRDVVDEARASTEARAVEIVISPRLPGVCGNPDRLRVVLGQLIANAVAFMGDRPDPRIEIAAEERGGVVEFSIRDNGIGIDPAYHDKIFEPFQRLDGTRPGTGAGLTIVDKIVTEDGGRVWVESAPGQGATFRFTVPCAAEPVAEPVGSAR